MGVPNKRGLLLAGSAPDLAPERCAPLRSWQSPFRKPCNPTRKSFQVGLILRHGHSGLRIVKEMAQAGKTHLFAQSETEYRIRVGIGLGQRLLAEQTWMLARNDEQKRGGFVRPRRSLRGNEQRGLPKQAFQKASERGARAVVGAVVAEMAFLTQGAQIDRAVVRRIMIQMRAGQNHGRLCRRKQPPLAVQRAARFTAPPRTNKANVVADRGPVRRIEVLNFRPVRHIL